MWRNYLLSLSFANLVYLEAWTDLIPVRPEDLFFRKTLPSVNLYFAIAGDVILLSLVTFLLICVAPRLPGWLRKALPIAAVAVVALAIRSVASEAGANLLRAGLFSFMPAKIVFLLAALFGSVAIGLAFRYSALTLSIARFVALAAAPCLVVTFAGSLFGLRAQSALPPDPPLAPRLQGSPPVRVLWILFDEWDERLTFPNRAPGTLLPVIDSLRERSFTASGALGVQAPEIAVDHMLTVDALPSLLYGKRLVGSNIKGPRTRRLDFADGTSTIFGAGDTIFKEVRTHGWNSAVAGWYLPYCRVFNPQLTDCYWDVRYQHASSVGSGLLEAGRNETRTLFETGMFSVFGATVVGSRHAAEYEALLAAARHYAADPSIGLAFLHFNVPHTPYFYNAKTGKNDKSGYSAALYDDELELVDRSVGDILTSLNRAGLDSKTAIILSSDHPARFRTRIDGRQNPHVPFIVHLPGETTGLAFTREFSTIRTAALVSAIAGGGVKSPSDIEKTLGF
jgi:Sulfatase